MIKEWTWEKYFLTDVLLCALLKKILIFFDDLRWLPRFFICTKNFIRKFLTSFVALWIFFFENLSSFALIVHYLQQSLRPSCLKPSLYIIYINRLAIYVHMYQVLLIVHHLYASLILFLFRDMVWSWSGTHLKFKDSVLTITRIYVLLVILYNSIKLYYVKKMKPILA